MGCYFSHASIACPPDESFCGLYLHTNREMAYAHAVEIERMTGDRCEVVKYGPRHYTVIRHDTSGKLM
jgi:hypothetical protein